MGSQAEPDSKHGGTAHACRSGCPAGPWLSPPPPRLSTGLASSAHCHSGTAAQSRQSCALLAAELRTMQDSNDVWSEQGPEIPTFCLRVQPLAGGQLPRGGKPRCLPASPRGPSSQCPPPPSPSRGAGTRRRRGGARGGEWVSRLFSKGGLTVPRATGPANIHALHSAARIQPGSAGLLSRLFCALWD